MINIQIHNCQWEKQNLKTVNHEIILMALNHDCRMDKIEQRRNHRTK